MYAIMESMNNYIFYLIIFYYFINKNLPSQKIATVIILSFAISFFLILKQYIE